MDAEPEARAELEARIAKLEWQVEQLQAIVAGQGRAPAGASSSARPATAASPATAAPLASAVEPAPAMPPTPGTPPAPPAVSSAPAEPRPQVELPPWIVADRIIHERATAAAAAAAGRSEPNGRPGAPTTPSSRAQATPASPAGTAPGAPLDAAQVPGAWQVPEAWRTPDGAPATPSTAPWAAALDAITHMSPSELEERFTGRALAWVGGVAVVLGAIFLLSLAFTNGWIGPAGRVLIGFAAGAIALVGGAVLLERGDRLLGTVLTPVGLAIISISLVGATRVYDLLPLPVGLAVALFAAVVTAVIAVRADSQLIAGFGLVSVLAAPPLIGASPDVVTLAFIAITLVGTTAVSLWRTWPWLPATAFVLAAPQAASWFMGDPERALALAGIAVFWALNAVASGGEEFHRRRNDLSPSSTTLLLANAAFAVWAGFTVLSGTFEPYRGAFLVVLALAQMGLGAYFVIRDGDTNLFGLLSLGTGIAILTLAAPVQLGAPAVPVAWSLEAVALAWVAARRAHPYSAIVSAILFLLAGAYLGLRVYAPDMPSSGTPFLDGAGVALAFFLASLAAGAWVVRDRVAWSALAALGVLVTTEAVRVELDGTPATIAFTAVLVVSALLRAGIERLEEQPVAWRMEGLIPAAWRPGPNLGRAALALPGLSLIPVGVLATWNAIAAFFTEGQGSVPFIDAPGAGFAVYLAGLLVVAILARSWSARRAFAALGIFVATIASATELTLGVAFVAAWAGLAVIGLALWRLTWTLEATAGVEARAAVEAVPSPGIEAGDLEPVGPEPVAPETLVAQGSELAAPAARPWWRPMARDLPLPVASLLAASLAVLHTVAVELPLAEFGRTEPPAVPFSDAGAAACAVLVGAALLAGIVHGGLEARRWAVIVAGGIIAYTIPYEVYAWAVVVLWVSLGIAAVVAAIVDHGGARLFGPSGLVMVVLATLVGVGIVAPPSRLVVSDAGMAAMTALETAAALASLVLGYAVLAWSERTGPWRRWFEAAVGIAFVYLCSVAVVDAFTVQVGGAVPAEELQRQGQVALSVTWTVLGLAAFVAGLWFRWADMRIGGLALLALATAKVFLVDLSALDVAYRVVSLVVLGLILLAAAWLWQRMRPHPPGEIPRAA